MKKKPTYKAPGKAYREGITLLDLLQMFPFKNGRLRFISV